MRRLNDKQVEIIIGQVLRIGTLLSCSVTAVGMFLYLLRNASTLPDYKVFHPINGKLMSLGQLIPTAWHGNPVAIIQLGILLLIATPVARVAFLIGAFALERDRLYVVVSGLVLAILLYSLVFSA
ncbi:MAG: DUF1634 domain-containing protein [Acidobacteriaceae bacterium]